MYGDSGTMTLEQHRPASHKPLLDRCPVLKTGRGKKNLAIPEANIKGIDMGSTEANWSPSLSSVFQPEVTSFFLCTLKVWLFIPDDL